MRLDKGRPATMLSPLRPSQRGPVTRPRVRENGLPAQRRRAGTANLNQSRKQPQKAFIERLKATDEAALEDLMISLTEEARKELEAYFEGKEKTPIRVYLAPGGCSGPRLALALDEPGEDDETSEDNGLTFCINKELAEKVGAVTINLTYMGFVVESEIPLPSSGGGCSSCCGGCGSSGGCH